MRLTPPALTLLRRLPRGVRYCPDDGDGELLANIVGRGLIERVRGTGTYRATEAGLRAREECIR